MRCFASTAKASNGPLTTPDEGLSYVVYDDSGTEKMLLAMPSLSWAEGGRENLHVIQDIPAVPASSAPASRRVRISTSRCCFGFKVIVLIPQVCGHFP